ncbi:hypothetical protein NIES4071_06010 [Calothrix sp. NIES-4071]|nr:hypothetical protein NIES4071_06010 [Calothrix sp. NIES-4071]BAZ54944.1 hypothetical protein NIES4105_05980 [Calothrix sp. NIES-4105]
MESSNSTNTSMLHTKIKKTLVSVLVVASTLIYIAQKGATVPQNNKQVSSRTAEPTKNTGNANNTQSSKRAVQPKRMF